MSDRQDGTYNFVTDVIGPLAADPASGNAIVWMDAAGQVVERSFAQLHDDALAMAAGLRELGVAPGDFVLVFLSRELEWWTAMLGCLRLGAIASPGTVQLTVKDIRHRLALAQPRCVIAGPDLAGPVDEALKAEGMERIARISVGGARDGWQAIESVLGAADPATIADVTTAGDADALCYFTSGTTGHPKMTIHAQRYAAAHRVTTDWLGLGRGDLHWNLSDTGWAKAAWSSLFGPWLSGATLFVHHAPFDPETVLDLLESHPITTMCAAPTAYRMLARGSLAGRSFRALRHCVSAGEPLNPEVLNIWEEHVGLTIYDGYGQTETVLLCGNRPGAVRFGSMGRPSAGIELGVIDENGERVPPGEEGDVALRLSDDGTAPGLFKRYWNAPEETAATRRKGWYLTGDRATMDEDGFFWFVGRSDDVILSAGYRIGPFEVESALFQHPSVLESAVVASPDELRGEVVKAFVVLRPGVEASDALAAELQDHVKLSTAPYKYPRRIEFVGTLPKTISGKIKRKELRAREWARA